MGSRLAEFQLTACQRDGPAHVDYRSPRNTVHAYRTSEQHRRARNQVAAVLRVCSLKTPLSRQCQHRGARRGPGLRIEVSKTRPANQIAEDSSVARYLTPPRVTIQEAGVFMERTAATDRCLSLREPPHGAYCERLERLLQGDEQDPPMVAEVRHESWHRDQGRARTRNRSGRSGGCPATRESLS